MNFRARNRYNQIVFGDSHSFPSSSDSACLQISGFFSDLYSDNDFIEMSSALSLCSYRSRESVIYSRYSSEESIASPEELHYTLGKTIGSGTYAKVKAAWSPFERTMIAIKIIDKQEASRDFLTKFLPREISALRRLNHPNIIRVFRMVETNLQVYFMLEIAQNGDLLDYINMRRVLPEPEARFVLRGISAGIAHCHSKGIVHRDLKCENIMLTKDMGVKIGDFGFSRQQDIGGVSTPCGSFSYAAPELFSGEPGSTYDGKKADIWSMGVILYAMVCGSLPFGDDTQVAKMLVKPLTFSRPITQDCKSLLTYGMLTTNVEMRCDITQLRICQWMRGHVCQLTPYQYTKYEVDKCLPKVDQFSTRQTDLLHGESSGQSVYLRPRPVTVQTGQTSAMNQAQRDTATTSQLTASTTDQTTSTSSSAKKAVHRRKKSAVARLEERQRILNDPTNSATVSVPMPGQGGRHSSMKGRISSAGRRLVSTILGQASSRSNSTNETDV